MADASNRGRRWRSLAPTAALAAGCIVVYAVAGGGAEPGPGPAVSPSPTGTVNTLEPATSTRDADVPYDIVDGVTISPYLPPAEALTAEVLDRVTSGWVLAVYEGGLLAQDQIMGDGTLDQFGSEEGPAVPRVLYLVSPEGDAWEAANLTELGLGEVLAWDSERDVALVTTRTNPPWHASEETLATLNLLDGEVGPSFTPCGRDLTLTGDAWPTSGGWAVTVYCESKEPAAMWQKAVYVDDAGNAIDPPDLPPLALDAVFRDSAGGYLIEFRYPAYDAEGQNTEGPYITVTAPDGTARGIDTPMDPAGNDAWSCAYERLAVPDAVAVTCFGRSEPGELAPLVATTLAVDPASASFATVSPWLEAGYPEEGGFHPGCLVGGREWGTQTTNGSVVGLWSRAGGSAEPVPAPPAAYLAIQCEGAVGSELVIRGAGPLLALDPTTEQWRTLLPAAIIPATGDEPERYVAGVTDLGVFVAP